MIPILQASAGAEIFSRTDPVRDAQEEVRAILEQVKAKGDAALKEYTKAFDGADISSIELGQGAIDEGFRQASPLLVDILYRAAERISAFHQHQLRSGFQTSDIPRIKYKSRMKEYYQAAGIPTARYHLVDDLKGCRAFIKEVGWPVVVKPDNGVGASDTHKLSSLQELKDFLETKNPSVTYIMEEFIHAEVNSYDAIIDSQGNPIFETGNVTPMSIMDIVNENDNSIYYIVKDLPADTRKAGRATVKSFGVKSRFVHFEFFRLTRDQEGMGKKGDVVALEVNMRPCGGFSPDMMNFANSTNVYKIWADMIAFDHSTVEGGPHAFCAFAGRRDGKPFVYDHEAIMKKYGQQMKMVERIPDVLSDAMGNQMYMATFPTQKKLDKFYHDVLLCKEG